MMKQRKNRLLSQVRGNMPLLKSSSHTRAPKSRKALLKTLKLFATDVDGVLTDAGMYYGESGDELKKFHTRDGMGIKLLQAEGLVTALITKEQTEIVARRGTKLGIPEVFQGVMDKKAVLVHLSKKYGIPCRQMVFMGDDVNDLEALQTVGFSASPADGVDQVRRVVDYVCKKKGGEGAVREVIDKILAARHEK